MPQATTAIRGNSLYTVIDGPSWTEAEANSVSLGGHLVAVTSQEENLWLHQNIISSPGPIIVSYFIGLTDTRIEGVPEWSSGEERTFDYFYGNQIPNTSYNDYFAVNSDGTGAPAPNGNEFSGWINVDETSSYYRAGLSPGVSKDIKAIAEIPLNLSITLSNTPKEGAGPFTTSINLSAGTQESGNLAEGAEVWWKVTGITADDLDSGDLTGTGVITNGKLDIQHSLKNDIDVGEKFRVSVFSNPEMTEQIGITRENPIVEKGGYTGPSGLRGNSLYLSVAGPTWTKAEANAIALGGHLTAITSEEENNWIIAKFSREAGVLNPQKWFKKWIGLRNSPDGLVHEWTTGETFSYEVWDSAAPRSRPYTFINIVFGTPKPPESGIWIDYWNEHPSQSDNEMLGIAEIPLNLSITLPTQPTEGKGLFTTSINLSAGTQASGNLAEGAQVWWNVTGITADDLDSGDLAGSGTITNGKLDIQHSLKTDADKGETLEVSVFSNVEMTEQIGATASVEVQEADPVFKVGTSTSNASPIFISGSSGPGTMAGVEALTTTRVNIGTARRPRWVNQTSYTATDRFTEVDGITFTGGSSSNIISAAGVTGDPLRPTFNGQLIADGGLSTDTITGGTYRNWLIGGGIFSSPQSRRTTAVDNLIGTRGALDVFDLRTSAFTADAYSAANSGSASITNYTKGEDHIVLSGAQTAYRITAQTRTSGRGINRTTVTTGYQIFSGAELVASVAPASGTGFTGTAATDLNILYGQQGNPTQTLFNGETLFFG